MDRAHLLIFNTFTRFLVQALAIGLTFITFPLLLRHVGDVQFGIYSLVTAFTGYFSVISFISKGPIVKYISENSSANNREIINRIYSTGFIVNMALGIVMSLILVLFIPSLGTLFRISSDQLSIAHTLVYIAAVSSIFNQPLSIYSSMLYGFQQYGMVGLVDVMINVLRGILVICIIYFKQSIVFFFAAETLLSLLSSVVCALLLFRINNQLRFSFSLISKDDLRRHFSYGTWTILTALSATLIFETDRILLGIYFSVISITIYQIGSKLHNMVNLLINILTSAIIPSVSNAGITGDTAYINKLKLTGTKFFLAISLPVITHILIFSGDIIFYWVGPSYSLEARSISQLLMCCWIISAPISYLTYIYWGQSNVKLLSIISFSGALLNIFLSIILLKILGPIGVVVATLCQYILVFPFQMRELSAKLSINLWHYLGFIILPLYVLNGIYIAGVYFISPQRYTHSIIYFILLFSSSLITNICLNWFILQKKEKTMIRTLITNIFLRPSKELKIVKS